MKYPTFKRGQKVRNCFGQLRTVRRVNGCQVFVFEECNSWYHPGKLFAA
jgi:hypothetical protein